MSDYNDQPLHRLEPAYLEHYDLEEPPFSATIDERFYFSTAEAAQQLSLMVHMTQYSDMVLMVIAEEGMGKTTLLQQYIKSAHDNWHICRINANTLMDKDQLLFRIAEDFGLEFLPANSAELQEMLYDKLTKLHQNDVLPVIIVDDAHELPIDAISQLFIMAEIKAGDVTMVHVVLFAEPSLEKTISASTARKIRERIGHSFELTPYDETDTAEYILSRMTIAGLRGENPFSTKVLRQIHKQSQGIPAQINELAHIALDDVPASGGIEPDFDETDKLVLESGRVFTPLRVFGILAVATLAGLGFWQQERINSLFEGSPQTPLSVAQPVPDNMESSPDKEASPFAKLKQKLFFAGRDKPAPASPPPVTPGTQQTDSATLEQIEDPAIAAQVETIDTALPAPVIVRLEPTTLTAAGKKQSLTLYGKHFTPDSTVTLSWSGNKKQLPDSRIHLESDSKMVIELATGERPDNWSVTVSDARGKTSSLGFQVVAAPPANQTAAQWIQAQPAKNLTLQLLGSHSTVLIDKYIAEHKLQDHARIYKTTHDNKDWYVLLYGSFTDAQHAQKFIQQLPARARHNKPWVRNFASVRAQQTKRVNKQPSRTVVSKTGAPPLNNLKAHEAWLWSQDPSHYTLQLLGTQNVDNIKQFIKQHRLRGKVVYYHTQRGQQDWYALVYGVYPNNSDARSAVGQLPAPIKKLSPWVRNFSAIHAEMGKPGNP